MESGGGRGGGVEAAQDHSGGSVADGMQARQTEGADQGGGGVRLGRRGQIRSSGDLAREGNRWSGGGLAMAHLLGVRHKNWYINGTPFRGAP